MRSAMIFMFVMVAVIFSAIPVVIQAEETANRHEVARKNLVPVNPTASILIQFEKQLEITQKMKKKPWWKSWDQLTTRLVEVSQGFGNDEVSAKVSLKGGKVKWTNPKDADKSIYFEVRWKGEEFSKIGYQLEF